MKNLKKYITAFMAILAFLMVTSVAAQEWTKDQQAVWQVVEDMFMNWKNNDIDAAFANVDENYLGWNNTDPLPVSKAKWYDSQKKYIEFQSKRDYDLEPARILVKDNAAVVHFYFDFWFKSTFEGEGKWVEYKGKWTAFFIKDGGEWMMLGDLTLSEKQ